MTRAAAAALTFAALICGAMLDVGRARAGGFPNLDEKSETILVGPKVEPLGDSVGDWTRAGDGVRPADGKAGAHWTWLAKDGLVGDGFVRARVTAAGGLSAAILLRATLPDLSHGDPTGAVSGYAVVIGNGEATLELWDKGMKRALVAAQKLKRGAGGVEVVAWMIGPQLVVELFDAKSLTSVASFIATDGRFPEGRAGVYAGGKTAGAQTLVLLSVSRARVKGAARDDMPPGPKRFLQIPATALAALDADDRREYDKMETLDGDRVVVRTDASGHERLRRLDIPIVWQGSDTPFKYIERAYLDARAAAPQATKTGFRIDRSYKDDDMVVALLTAYHDRFPKLTRLVELGRTASGRPILALVISDHAERREAEPAVLLDGSHHGNELMPVDNVLDAVQVLLEQYASDPAVARLVDNLEIWAVPLVNPDGNWAFWQYSSQAGRKNVRDTDGNGRFDPTDGVDLNRNYPFRWGALGESASRSFARHEYYRGLAPASEAEVRAMLRLSDSEHFAASVSYHTVSNVILVPYTTDGVLNPEPNEAWVIAEEIAKSLPTQPTGKRMGVAKKIYAVDGVDQDHFRATNGTVAFLVEGPYHNPLAPKLKAATLASTRGTWRALLERLVAGPVVSGTVRDADGHALRAEVVVRELRPRNGERWLTRCRDGRFDRMLPAAGRYSLEISAPGFVTKSLAVTADRQKPMVVDVRLERGGSGDSGRLCGDVALSSIDAWCACQAGECGEPGPPTWCRIDGACVRAGASSSDGHGVCDPLASQIAWQSASN